MSSIKQRFQSHPTTSLLAQVLHLAFGRDLVHSLISSDIKYWTRSARPRQRVAKLANPRRYKKDHIAEALCYESGNKLTVIYKVTFDQDVIDEENEAVCKF